jgi:hypothetical protein
VKSSKQTAIALAHRKKLAETAVMSTNLKCLIVGMASESFARDDLVAGEVEIVDPSTFASLDSLPTMLVLVVVPLFGRNFDALEILEHLATKGFRGTLRVVAPHLPNRQIVLRELRSHAARQGISIELVEQTSPPS